MVYGVRLCKPLTDDHAVRCDLNIGFDAHKSHGLCCVLLYCWLYGLWP